MNRRLGKVVLIDDSEFVLEATQLMLEARGIELIAHATPFGAVLVVGRERPDIVLVDLEMASMRGTSVITSLRSGRRSQGIPLVLYSDRPEVELEAAARECGADGFIQKTGNADVLIRGLMKFYRPPATESSIEGA